MIVDLVNILNAMPIDKNYRILCDISGCIPPFCGILWKQQPCSIIYHSILKDGALPLDNPAPVMTFWAINIWRLRFHIPTRRGILFMREEKQFQLFFCHTLPRRIMTFVKRLFCAFCMFMIYLLVFLAITLITIAFTFGD